jgi:hypothetical protein
MMQRIRNIPWMEMAHCKTKNRDEIKGFKTAVDSLDSIHVSGAVPVTRNCAALTGPRSSDAIKITSCHVNHKDADSQTECCIQVDVPELPSGVLNMLLNNPMNVLFC